MKALKSEQEYTYDDFRKMQCGACKKKLWNKGREIMTNARLQFPQCSTFYSFEPTRWRVLADIPEM